ncbi:DNA-deoxyinosine glycosylase [Flavobacterium caeni]|uniref:G/U mismatch-specific uracil-DNA glycosylase n=1 Tax=Flavobacterium caeni TaxID=490189 RepID=A0A1G5CWG6_9FLAO|nr:DNA-deoxyinosine glycosylase [Flavobacterium caeni]SCY06734.1 G/U mismatch-specific uracil-DNA glycosylase [Flavobacterium caeni]
MIASFAPILPAAPKILILGTMPGAVSLAEQQYYAHKQNHFWKILFAVLAEVPVPDSYAERLELLHGHGIALWDVLEYCERQGSLDSNIRNPKENDILGLLEKHPSITDIVFNGQQSHKFFTRAFGQITGVALHVMPSTSPAHTMKFEDKRAAWSQVIRRSTI